MPSNLSGPARRDAVLAVVALALLLAPLWAGPLHLDDPTYRYERARVVADDGDIAYANESAAPYETPISEEIGCSIPREVRICAFERYVAANNTVPTGVYTNNPNHTFDGLGVERYRYALVDGSAYRTVYVPNRSVRNDEGMYREDLGLRPVPAADVLDAVARDATVRREELPPPVLAAARDGAATAHRRIAVPPTPIELDGAYYRVYLAERTTPLPGGRLLDGFLTYVAPAVGVIVLTVLRRRVEVTYVGGSDR